MSDVLIKYNSFHQDVKLPTPIWMVVVEGSLRDGGTARVLIDVPKLGYLAGDKFSFGSDTYFVAGQREVLLLENAPLEIVATWMKLKHTGLI